MKLKLPKHAHGFTDRHGKARYYFRRPGFARATLPGVPYSPEFMAAYEAAMAGEDAPLIVGASRSSPGTIGALVALYLGSAAFNSLSKSTRATYRGIIERFRVEHGDKRVSKLERAHIARMVTGKAATPAAANNFLRIVRMLMQFAIVSGMRDTDPTVGVRPIKNRTDGFHTWTEDEIATFEARHKPGTRARLAFDLLLWTGQRRGDVVLLGRQHVKGGVLRLRQQKTGAVVEIPLHASLKASIEAGPTGDLTFLVTKPGKPFTAAGFGGWFRTVCDEAGLSGCSAHGLRKAASRRLAEAGCTAHEIMSITGHRTLKEVTRYTAAVDRRELAKSAMSKTEGRTVTGKPE